jgi:hypothetical protein
MGVLEATVMAMHCRATCQDEEKLKSRLNGAQREGLKSAAKSLGWPADIQADLEKRLSEIGKLDTRRNRFVHIAAGIVSDDSIDGVPAGSVIDLRTCGIGRTKVDGGTETFGIVAKKIDLVEIDNLVDDIQKARLGLVPYMELVDEIIHPQSSGTSL